MKTRVFTTIGLCVCLLVSCTSERTDISTFLPKEGKTVKITAYADGTPQTKTGLVDKVGGGKSVVWKSGNAISLFFNSGSNGGNKFTTTTNGPIAEFVGSITAVSGDLSGIGGSAHFWGLYPYKSSASCDGHTITTTLPANQKAYQGDVADNLLVTVGRSIDLSIHFKNACSVIGFTVSQENIKKIVFSGNAEEPVAGEFTISFDENENLVDAPTSNAVNQIVITPAETTTFEPGVTYYFAMLPNQFSAGYSMTFTKSDNSEATFIREDNCTFEISTFYKLTKKDEGLTFIPSPISDENIVFADDKVKAKLVAAFDTNEDGELSYAEAAAVTSIEGVFGNIKTYKSFDEFQFFTGVASIPYSMFANWNLLTSIVLPESILEIGDSAFVGCVKLSSIVIPENVTSIGHSAFYGCSSVTSIDLPESVTFIGSYDFYGCTSLTTIEIPESVISIEDCSFSGCSSLTTIEIPKSVSYIGFSAFSGCSSLATIEIPETVTSIGNAAFSGCSSLATIEIPESVTYIGSSAFLDCSSLATIEIPETVTTIGNSAFSGCSSLATIEISEGVTRIGGWAFSDCISLTSLVIPESLTLIENDVFSNCSSLTSIDLPESVISIGERAFQGCSSLATIEIPESVTSIGERAFYGCSSLTSVVIPESVTSIRGEVFYGCSSLTTIEIPSSLTRIYYGTFSGCSRLTSIIIPESVTSIGDYAFYGCSSLTSIDIPEALISIGDAAFTGCSSLTSIDIPESVNYLGGNAFNGCSSLVTIEIPESVTSIGDYTFSGCSSLATIEIPESVTSIGGWAFSGCSGLTSIVIPESVTSIGDYAFNGCSRLGALVVLSTIPPQFYYHNLTNFCSIYVPDESVDAYKETYGWSTYASRIFSLSMAQKSLEEIAADIINQYLSGDIYSYIDNTHNPVSFAGPSVLYKYLGPRKVSVIVSDFTEFHLEDALPEYFNSEYYYPETFTVPMTIAPTQTDSLNLFSDIQCFFARVAAIDTTAVPNLNFVITRDGGLTYSIEKLRADLLEFRRMKMITTNGGGWLEDGGIYKASGYDNKGFASTDIPPEPAYYYDAFSNVIDLFLHFIGQGTLNETLYGPEDENYSINNL